MWNKYRRENLSPDAKYSHKNAGKTLTPALGDKAGVGVGLGRLTIDKQTLGFPFLIKQWVLDSERDPVSKSKV